MTDTTLVLDRLLSAPPQKVWRCWTEANLLKRWFAPHPVETTEAEIDPQPGGIFRTVMMVPDLGEIRGTAGCVLVAEPAQRLVWTNILGPDFCPNVMGTGPMDFGFSVDISFASEGNSTRYIATVRHATPDHTKAHADMGFHDGWGMAATQLDAVAQTL